MIRHLVPDGNYGGAKELTQRQRKTVSVQFIPIDGPWPDIYSLLMDDIETTSTTSDVLYGISNVLDVSSNLCTYCVPQHSWTRIKSFDLHPAPATSIMHPRDDFCQAPIYITASPRLHMRVYQSSCY
jgi:hypothetical protein